MLTRSGWDFLRSIENITSDNTSTVFPVDLNGNVTGAPFTIIDNNPKSGNTLLGVYLQDEWKPFEKLTVNYGLRFDQMDAFVESRSIEPPIGPRLQGNP